MPNICCFSEAAAAPGKRELMATWQAFLEQDTGNVTLLAFDGTILQAVRTSSMCLSTRTCMPMCSLAPFTQSGKKTELLSRKRWQLGNTNWFGRPWLKSYMFVSRRSTQRRDPCARC